MLDHTDPSTKGLVMALQDSSSLLSELVSEAKGENYIVVVIDSDTGEEYEIDGISREENQMIISISYKDTTDSVTEDDDSDG